MRKQVQTICIFSETHFHGVIAWYQLSIDQMSVVLSSLQAIELVVKFTEKYAKHISFSAISSFSATQIANFINIDKLNYLCSLRCRVFTCSLHVSLYCFLDTQKIESCLAVVQTTHLSLTLMHGLSYAYHFLSYSSTEDPLCCSSTHSISSSSDAGTDFRR